MGKGSKVFGRPLQALYQRLQGMAGAPPQPVILKELQSQLAGQGLTYHSRTLKRQLLGDIEYIPQIVEDLFLAWLKKGYPQIFSRLEETWRREKEALAASGDTELYLSPVFFLKAADAYLLLHKDLSRRQLAIKLRQSLEAKGFHFGLETLQAALSGKTQKIRKVVEDQLIEYFLAEGFASRGAIEVHLSQNLAQEIPEVQKIEVGDIAERVDGFLLQAGGFSKRQLSMLLKDKLERKGYHYHLSSLQSVIEGTTRKTRKVVLDTLQDIFQAHGMGEIPALDPEQLSWNHYVDAAGITTRVEKILNSHPQLTRRQVARLLQEDLKARHFSFSLNTLQFILAGKTQRVKKVIPDLLEEYLGEEGAKRLQAVRQFQILPRKGRQSLEHRVAQAFERLKQATDAERDACFREFLFAREELIRHRWERRRTPIRSRREYDQEKTWGESFGEGEEENYPNEYSASDQESLGLPLGRLVS